MRRNAEGVAVDVGPNDAQIVVAPEAIVIVDIVESTLTSNLFGWYAVGRGLLRELRDAIRDIGRDTGLRCMKCTGDGYLLTYGDDHSAEVGAMCALDASTRLVQRLDERNADPATPEQCRLNIRIAVHFGEVDVIDEDREGPHVSYAFRLAGVNRESLTTALNPLPPQQLPLKNYILLSEPVARIMERRDEPVPMLKLGLFHFKGFQGWWEVYLHGNDNADPPDPVNDGG